MPKFYQLLIAASLLLTLPAPAWALGKTAETGWGASLAPLRILADVVEVRGEWRDPTRVLAILLAGGHQSTSDPYEQSHTVVGAGVQAMRVGIGDTRNGVLLGGELRYEHKGSDSTSEFEHILGTSHAASVGAFLAFRLTAELGGIFVESQVGGRWRWIRTDTSCCGDVRDLLNGTSGAMFAAMNLGWLW